MYVFSKRSLDNLASCHTDLQKVLHEMIKVYDVSVICGHRGKAAQDEAFRAGKSKARWGQSKHNSNPSMAVDIAPYPIDWNNLNEFYYMAGLAMGIAHRLKAEGEITHDVRWGGRFNSFFDGPHLELIDP